MKVKVIVCRWWYHDTRYVGRQPRNLSEQLEEEINHFLKSAGKITITSIQQSLSRDDGTETALVTIFYEK